MLLPKRMSLKLMLMLHPRCHSASAETQTLVSLKSAAEAVASTQAALRSPSLLKRAGAAGRWKTTKLLLLHMHAALSLTSPKSPTSPMSHEVVDVADIADVADVADAADVANVADVADVTMSPML